MIPEVRSKEIRCRENEKCGELVKDSLVCNYELIPLDYAKRNQLNPNYFEGRGIYMVETGKTCVEGG